jgi:SAM-dependent methyltransferase
MINYTPYILEEIRKVNKMRKSEVLDIGCGIGQYFPYLKGNITGIDFDLKNVKRARKNYPKAKVFHHDLSKFPLPVDRKYDVVICLELIEHMKKKDALKLIRELEKITKGYLLISTPNINNFTSLVRYVLFKQLEIAGSSNTVEKILYLLKYKKLPPKNNKYYVMEPGSENEISNKNLHFHVSNFSSTEFKRKGYQVLGGLGQVNYETIKNKRIRMLVEYIFYRFPYFSGSFLAIKKCE